MVAVTRYYHAEDQYLETFTELQHYLINSLVCIRTLQIMTYGYSHPLSSYSSVTRFQVKAHILRVRGQSVSHAANLTGDVLPQLPLVEPKSMVYYIQLCFALISLSNRSSVTRPPRHQRWTLYSACSIPQAFLSRSNLGKEAIPRAPRYKIFFYGAIKSPIKYYRRALDREFAANRNPQGETQYNRHIYFIHIL